MGVVSVSQLRLYGNVLVSVIQSYVVVGLSFALLMVVVRVAVVAGTVYHSHTHSELARWARKEAAVAAGAAGSTTGSVGDSQTEAGAAPGTKPALAALGSGSGNWAVGKPGDPAFWAVSWRWW